MRSLFTDWRHQPTQRKVWALALPMIASNITVPLVTLTDSTVAGHLPHAAQLAAVAVGGIIYLVPVWVFGFLRMGTVGFASQAAGRRDGDAMRGILLQALMLALLLALVSMVALFLFMQPVLALMRPSSELQEIATGYLNIRLFGLPAALGNYALMGWFLGGQNARVPMRILVVTNVSNIVLNLLFVLGFGWGVPGIALASVLGEWAGLASGLGKVPAMLARWSGSLHLARLRRWATWSALLSVNRDIMIRSIALQGVFFAITALGSRLGDNVVAANALLLNGLLLTSFALDGLANAIEALAGHAIGAGNRSALRRAVVVAGGWSLVGGLVFALLFAVGGRLFVDMQSNIEEVRQTAYPFLPYLAVLPLFALWGYLFDGLFVGATRAHEMRNAMLVSAAGFALLAWLLRSLGNHGLWLAFFGFTALRGGVMAWMSWHITQTDGWFHRARRNKSISTQLSP